MADRPLKLRELTRILGRFGVGCDPARGKGSHVMFFLKLPEGTFTFPVPNRQDVLVPYVKGARRKFRLTPADGVSDDQFYGS